MAIGEVYFDITNKGKSKGMVSISFETEADTKRGIENAIVEDTELFEKIVSKLLSLKSTLNETDKQKYNESLKNKQVGINISLNLTELV